MSDILKLVGDRIRLFRKSQGLTQEELAEKAGLQYSYIGGVERGERNISLETLEKIIDGLGIFPYELFKLGEAELDSSVFNKKQKIEAINNLLIERDEHEIGMVYRLVRDIVQIVDSK